MSTRMMLSSLFEQRGGQRARQLGLADAGGAEEEEGAMGRRGSLMPARARTTASATARTASSCPTTPLCAALLEPEELLHLALHQLLTGMPVQRETTSAMSSSSTSSLMSRRPPPAGLGFQRLQLALQLGEGAVLQLGRARQVARAHHLLDLDPRLLDALAELAWLLDGRLLGLHCARSAAPSSQLGQLLLELLQAVARGRVRLLLQRLALDLRWRICA